MSTDPGPSTSAVTSSTNNFSVANLTSTSPKLPVFANLPQFPPIAFLQLVSQYMAQNSATAARKAELEASQEASNSRKRKRKPTASADSSPSSEKSVKLGNYDVPCGELPTTSTVIYEENRTPERSAEEKDEAQKLIQNALSEMKRSRARRESVEDQGRISTPPGEMNSADMESMAKIRGHPMFPVLRLFTEKVESATYEMKSSVFKLTDVEALFVELESQGASPRTDDLELDRLVWDAIYVMRLHLAELARVTKLAEDFRVNFSASLKKRVNHETLIGVINESDEEASTSDGESNSRSSLRDHPANTTVAMMNTPHGTLSIPLTLPPINHHLAADSYDLGSPAGKRTRFDFNSSGSHSSSGFMERLGSSRDL